MSLPDAVVLFGASGFIGRNIVEALRGRVELIGVTSNGGAVPGCDRVVASTDLATLPALPQRSAIVHVAAFRYFATRFATQQAAIVSNNVALTDLIYRFALDRGIGEVRAASSSAVYPADWSELDDTRPLDLNAWPHVGEAPYAWSKRWGEIAADLWHQRGGVNTISFRLTNPYGPFDTLDESEAHVATAFVIRALRDTPKFEVRGDPAAERDFVFSGDVAAAFVASLNLEGVHAAVNCAAGRPTRIIDLADSAMRMAGNVRPVTTSQQASPGVRRPQANVQRLRQILPDLQPFSALDDGIRRTVEWYRDALR